MSTENNQNICRMLVEREIGQNWNLVISELAKFETGEYFDDTYSLSLTQDWLEPALEHAGQLDNDDEFDELEWFDCGEFGISLVDCLKSERIEAAEYCDRNNIEPHLIEALEYWTVSDFMARKLAEHGQPVAEICGHHVWGRPTSGQAILLDSVIVEIAASMEILTGQANEWSA